MAQVTYTTACGLRHTRGSSIRRAKPFLSTFRPWDVGQLPVIGRESCARAPHRSRMRAGAGGTSRPHAAVRLAWMAGLRQGTLLDSREGSESGPRERYSTCRLIRDSLGRLDARLVANAD